MRQAKNLHARDLVRFVEVQNDAGRDLFGLDDAGFVEAKIQGIGFSIYVEFQ